MNDKKEFVAYLQKKYKDLSEEKLKLLQESGLLEKDYKEFLKSKKLKALHGAKLNYIKSLKNQCAEDEELYYYKKGGIVGCGCKKKEDGGEIKKAKAGCSVVDKFKKMQHGGQPNINKNDTIHVNGQVRSLTRKPIKDKKKTYKPLTNDEYKKLKNNDKNRVDEKDIARGRQVAKSGMKVEKDCGGTVAKFKKHQLGGSLNGIPFYLGGTPKAGIRYKGGKKDSFKNENHENVDVIIGQKPNFYTHAPLISRIISSDGNDTTFVEVPEHTSFTTAKPRVAKNDWVEDLNNKKIYNNSPEYYTMRRRFSEASLASPGKFKFFVPKPYTPLKYTFGN